MSHNGFKLLLGLALFATLLGAGLSSQGTANAAPISDANVGTGSCGDTGGGPLESYCSWNGTGTEPTIGNYSCTVEYSCTELGDDVTILDESCNADQACRGLAGTSGSARVGDNSCNAVEACEYAGQYYGIAVIGDRSCNGVEACFEAGWDGGNAVVGDDSCNWESACEASGSLDVCGAEVFSACSVSEPSVDVQDVETPVVIGNGSCNQSGQYDDFCRLIHEDVGDCEYNDADKVPQSCNNSCGTSFFDVPDEGPFFDFYDACAGHDACYAEGGSEADRSACDKAFLSEMRASCSDMWSRSQRLQTRQCNQTAFIYYTLVSRYGRFFFGEL